MRRQVDRLLPLRGPMPAITVGVRVPLVRHWAGTALRVLMRGMALLCLAEGVQQWLRVLTEPDTISFSSLTPLHLAALMFFCILDFVAAVGLWLLARWGVAVWLAIVVGHGLAAALAPGVLARPDLLIGLDAAMLVGYAALALVERRESRRPG